MGRFRKTSRLTKKGGSSNNSDNSNEVDAANTLLKLQGQKSQDQDNLQRSNSPPPNNKTKSRGTMQSPETPERVHNPSGPVAAAMGNAFGFEPGSKRKLFGNDGGGYKKSRKNSRIKSKRKKGGKSAKKRRRRTRGKKR